MGKTYKKNGSGIARSVNYKANKNRKFTKIKYKSSHSSNRNKNKNILNDESFIPFDCKQNLHKYKSYQSIKHKNLLNIPNYHYNEFSDDSLRSIYDYKNITSWEKEKYKPWKNDTLENNLNNIKKDIYNSDKTNFKRFGRSEDSHKNVILKFIKATLKQLNRRDKVSKFRGHNRKNKFVDKVNK